MRIKCYNVGKALSRTWPNKHLIRPSRYYWLLLLFLFFLPPHLLFLSLTPSFYKLLF